MRSVGVLIVVFALLIVFGPVLAPYDPTAINIPKRLQPPGGEWLLGTDALGRDILSRLLHGARWSLGLAFVVSFLAQPAYWKEKKHVFAQPCTMYMYSSIISSNVDIR